MVRKKFGEILLEHGIITQDALDQALRKQKVSFKQIGQILEEIGMISEEDIAQGLSRQFKIPYIKDFSSRDIPRATLSKLDPTEAAAKQAFPLKAEQGTLYLAMVNPLDMAFQQELSFKLGMAVTPFVATPAEVEKAIERHYVCQMANRTRENSLSVLHVARNESSLDEVGKVLGKEGFLIHQGKTAKEALTLAMQFKPQLIIADEQLKKEDVKTLFKALQKNRETASIPVIALSYSASAADEGELLDMGFFDFIARPIDSTRLLARVRRGIRYFQTFAPLRSRAA